MKIFKNLFGSQKKEDWPLGIKWKETKNNLELAKNYDDFRAIQKIHAELEWLARVYNYHFIIEQNKLNYTDSHFGKMISGEISEGDREKIDIAVYKKLKFNDLLIPETFDLNNKIHYEFCEELVADFEKTLSKFQDQEDAMKENDLLHNRILLHRVLSFMANIKWSSKDYVDREYFLGLQKKLENIQ